MKMDVKNLRKTARSTVIALLLSFSVITQSVASLGDITTVAGLANPASFYLTTTFSARRATTDGAGNLFFTDPYGHRVMKRDSSGNVTIVAGTGVHGYGGDGGPAVSAQLNSPFAIALDPQGNIYFSDSENFRIRMINTAGVISTVAGIGVIGSSGDGAEALNAKLTIVMDLAFDSIGNLFFVDTLANRVRKIDTNGVISTVAGTGTSGYSGDGGVATAARLYAPNGIETDAQNNLYISDAGNHVVRYVNAQGIISTVAGTGNSGYSGDNGLASAANLAIPFDILSDKQGGFYVSDTGYHVIRHVDGDGIITTIAGNGSQGLSGDNGSASSAELNYPRDLSFDTNGNLIICDEGNTRIRAIDANSVITTIIASVHGYSGDGGPGSLAQLNHPNSLSLDSNGNLFIADVVNNRIRKLNTTGQISTFAGTYNPDFAGDGAAAELAHLAYPYGVAIDDLGQAFIADTLNHRIRKVNVNGIINTFAGTGVQGDSGDGSNATMAEIDTPYAMAVDKTGNLYFTEFDGHRIRMVNSAGIITTIAGTGVPGYSGDDGPATLASIDTPYGIVLDSIGNIYFSDSGNHRIRKIDKNGVITTYANNIALPDGLVFDNSGNLYIADPATNRVLKMNTDKRIFVLAGTGTAGFSGDGGPSEMAKLNGPSDVAVDSSGNVYIADNDNHRVRKVETDIQPPLITLIGDPVYSINVGDNFSDPGVTVTDNIDTGLNAAVDGSVDNNKPGFYQLTYYAMDSFANAALPVDRVVEVKGSDGGGSGSFSQGELNVLLGLSGLLIMLRYR